MPVVWQCSKDKLDPTFCQDVDELLTLRPETWYVTSSFRGLAEQAVLYIRYQAGGAKAAPAGMSAHNFGLAVDVVLDGSMKPGLQMNWDTGLPAWLGLRAAIAAHPRLHSGWSFGDWPHIEAVNWKGKRYPKPLDRVGVMT
ncbi:hypothetical protein UFOVP1537_44 [uncultured Caudovirales phage]|uniref:D-alanyl-D-alanine carboxypeptidase n=2 Tax=root TaxID=1 RepID=A0A6J5SSV5_9CAUD|nr:hypothetical protein UFOVP825_9 [uncultured Caudovirales phage]CAB4171319.1 hypothetical protein UFOVP915_44 [uncultured Caudovirales phage]CAB4177191.1 hypothetical protein UFOVP1000_8 [uncultured Caudovirales phage]CAB4183097.1 hypothetical protein UFOVP1092_36 [uncultured Caudovirales phage]CAB4187643.1 hypothetical protein UFOVP1152_40 [uncultured Caudovirales phage]